MHCTGLLGASPNLQFTSLQGMGKTPSSGTHSAPPQPPFFTSFPQKFSFTSQPTQVYTPMEVDGGRNNGFTHAREARAPTSERCSPQITPRVGQPLTGARSRGKPPIVNLNVGHAGPLYTRPTISHQVRNRSVSAERQGSMQDSSKNRQAWVPTGIAQARISLPTYMPSSMDSQYSEGPRSRSSTPRRRPRNLLFADLYADAVARRCRSSLNERYKEEVEREKIANLQQKGQDSKPRYQMKDQRTHSERERDFVARKQEFQVRSQAEKSMRQQHEIDACSFQPNVHARAQETPPSYLAAYLGVVEDVSPALNSLAKEENHICRQLKLVHEEEAQLSTLLEKEVADIRAQMQMEETSKVIAFLNTDEGRQYLRTRVTELNELPPAEAQSVIVNDLVHSSHSRVEDKVNSAFQVRKKELESGLELRKLKLQYELDQIKRERRELESPPEVEPLREDISVRLLKNGIDPELDLQQHLFTRPHLDVEDATLEHENEHGATEEIHFSAAEAELNQSYQSHHFSERPSYQLHASESSSSVPHQTVWLENSTYDERIEPQVPYAQPHEQSYTHLTSNPNPNPTHHTIPADAPYHPTVSNQTSTVRKFHSLSAIGSFANRPPQVPVTTPPYHMQEARRYPILSQQSWQGPFTHMGSSASINHPQ